MHILKIVRPGDRGEISSLNSDRILSADILDGALRARYSSL